MWLAPITLVVSLILAPVEPSLERASPEAGATWFVRADAPPGGTGRRFDPFDTIQEGIDAARPGDRVDVGPGTYRGELDTRRSGEPGARIELIGRGAVILGGDADRLIEIHHDFVTLHGFEIAGADVLVRIEGASYVRLVGNLLHTAGSECVRIVYLASDNVVAHNVIRGCGQTDFDLPEDHKNGEGVYIGTAPEQLDENPTPVPDRSDRNRIEGNRITSPAECVDVKEAASRTLIVDNVCRGVRDPETGGISSRGDGSRILRNLVTGSAGAGVRLGGDELGHGTRSVVVGNFLRGNEGYGVKIMRTPQRRVCGNRLSDNGLGATNDDSFRPGRACPSAADLIRRGPRRR